ncbi:Nramp family divalent metal transporter [Photobacterium damselae subsp. damselae]|uniref:Divalent metal cation transporter MntH n=2 Tax=Photobacterium damselae TaxID=38293 RepID=A0AAD3WU58_PHODD|nr:Nramp family divalent metal transporter [Photobacterium damselae]ELV7518795.1 Nramp family divalent metal transporter [Photobacterium damselae]KAB1179139.1 divalent metal cation transporter [Photobacterium damselae subsp. damselae]MCG9706034.1 Nramp family divalent metal transporter [Photobacterium damselae]NVH49188.1 Nramp family divalent metal transporter [Photobacterium damselae subsp. damselae]OEC82281.1 divalent metal cation transporter [Photobacterium damselae subsp. damselae]
MSIATADKAEVYNTTISKFKRKLLLLGPAFIAAIGYIDPGNFATNIESGSSYGYQLLWVVLWANLMAMLIQYLSAKLGIVTGKNLAEHLRDHLPKWAIGPYWVQAEIIAIATDLAEFIGAAVGFQLVFGISLMEGAIITAVASILILMLNKRGQKPLEAVIGSLLMLVAVIYVVELFYAGPSSSELSKGLIVPSFNSAHEIYLAAGILGATVMPHVIYLHSALFKNSYGEKTETRLRSTKVDVLIAMVIAGFVNIAIVAMAAAVFHYSGNQHVAEIETAYMTLTPLVGKAASLLFGISLIASGLSSTVVGTMAGQVVMQGFVHFKIPMWVRRSVTMIPSFIVIGLGLDTTQILVMSQVVLSFGIALAIIPLLMFTNSERLMGEFKNTKTVNILGVVIVTLVLALNGYLMVTLA